MQKKLLLYFYTSKNIFFTNKKKIKIDCDIKHILQKSGRVKRLIIRKKNLSVKNVQRMNSKKNGDTTRLQMIRFLDEQETQIYRYFTFKEEENKMKNEVIFENKRMQIFTRKT